MTALQLRDELSAVEAQIEEYALTGDDDSRLQAIRANLVAEIEFAERAESAADAIPVELFECDANVMVGNNGADATIRVRDGWLEIEFDPGYELQDIAVRLSDLPPRPEA